MQRKLSDNVVWARGLLHLIYMPMVARKVGRAPLTDILTQVPPGDHGHVRAGIEALSELQIVVVDSRDVCITNRSEALLQAIDNLALATQEQFAEEMASSPKFAALLKTIEGDSRLSPPK